MAYNNDNFDPKYYYDFEKALSDYLDFFKNKEGIRFLSRNFMKHFNECFYKHLDQIGSNETGHITDLTPRAVRDISDYACFHTSWRNGGNNKGLPEKYWQEIAGTIVRIYEHEKELAATTYVSGETLEARIPVHANGDGNGNGKSVSLEQKILEPANQNSNKNKSKNPWRDAQQFTA
jgi:hypothetical protein